jgi:iron complex outermembrane receptor protein
MRNNRKHEAVDNLNLQGGFMKRDLTRGIRRALVMAGAIAAGAPLVTAYAQEGEGQGLEVVLVTGSYIRGTAEDAALPVDVVTIEDLEKQGSPTMVDLFKSIPAVQGITGESNQFTAGQTTGTSNVNLRGLGPTRTLVLFNGRRVGASAAAGIGVDTNLLPTAAIGRIEVLKDGAAATYGSDAIGGVVNFISRRGFDGMSVDGSYTYIEDSDGDYSTNFVWGRNTGDYDVLVTVGYRHRSELNALERDFAISSIQENQNGGFSGFGNPGVYTIAGAPAGVSGAVVDPACQALGGVRRPAVPTAAVPNPAPGALMNECQFQFTQFDNIVEREEHYNIYTEFNTTFGNAIEFHADAFYAAHDVPEENSSPAYAPNQGPNPGPNGTTAPNFAIPLANPGLQALLPMLDPMQADAIRTRNGLIASGLQWRPFGNGGNPLTGEGKQDERFFDAYRVSTSLKGDLGTSTSWDLGVTYMEGTREASTPDILVSRLQRALSGFGGSNCPLTGGAAGVGDCKFFNPFSNGIQSNPMTGAVNDVTFNPALVNDRDVVAFLFEDYAYKDTTTVLAADLVFNGELGLKLPGGEIGWAFGGQYREDTVERDPNDISDININPCSNTPLTGNTNCGVRGGAFSFFGPLTAQDLQRDVYATFGELSLPIFESLQAQLAVRYEDYGGAVGSTTNPKLSLRYQAFDWLALRGSVGSTFRAPPQNQLLSSSQTALAFTSLSGGQSGYKPYDTFGNPNLKPEEADTYNVGFLINAGGFTASFDYFSFDFSDPIDNEGGTDLVAAFFGTSTMPINRCGDAAFAGLQQRFTFINNQCAVGNLLRTRVNTINGPDQLITGVDASLAYTFDDVLGGRLTLGTDASYYLKYEVDELVVEGVVIDEAQDFAGTRGGPGSLPDLRGTVFADWSTQRQSVRLTSRYIDGVTDVRPNVAPGSRGKEVGSFLTHDVTYRLEMPRQMTIAASVLNFTDRDPPFARLDLNYDTFLGNPLGRQVRMNLSKRFE